MDENALFQSNDQNLEPVSSEAQPQSQPSEQPVVSPPASPPSYESSNSFLRISKIIFTALGVLLILFLLFHFVFSGLFKKQNEKVTISYWGLWEDASVVNPVISDFEKQNPTISIQYSKESIKQYRQRLTSRIQNGTGPDVFRFHNTWLPELVTNVLPLPQDVISKDEFQKSFYPVTVSDLTRNGAVYGIPLEIDPLSLFVNSDIFQSAGISIPLTWEDFVKDARSLTVKDENGRIKTAGAALGTFDNVDHASDILSLLFFQNGADIQNLSQTSQNASDALSFYTSFALSNDKVWDSTLDPSTLAFSKGNLAMYFGYSWDVFNIKAINPNLNFSIKPVPHLPNRNTTIVSYWAEGISPTSKHQKEALLFLKFLTQKEQVQKLFSEESKTRLFGEPYGRVDLADSLKDNQMAYFFVSQANDSKSSFFASNTFDDGLNSQMNAYLGNAVRSVLGNGSPQSAVETLAQGVAAVLKQYAK